MRRPKWWQVAALLGVIAFAWVQALAWQGRARLGVVRFLADGPTTAIRVVDAAGETIVAMTIPPDDETIALPEGTYHVVATHPGSMSLATVFDVVGGQATEQVLDLESARLGEPVPIDRKRGDTFGFVDFGTRRDLLVLRGDGSGASRHVFGPRRTVWEGRPLHNLDAATPLGQARRLDDDEEPDVVWCGATGLVAMSGRTGLTLWVARPDVPAPLVGPACWLGDIDDDSIDDLCWGAHDWQTSRIEARSGRDGHPLWRAELPGGTAPGPAVLLARPGGGAIVTVVGSHLVALDPTDGKPLFPTPVKVPDGNPIGTDRDGDGKDDHWLIFDASGWVVIDPSDGKAVVSGRPPGQPAWIEPPRWLDAGRLLIISWVESFGAHLSVHAPGVDAPIWESTTTFGNGLSPPPTPDVNGDKCRDVIFVREIAAPPAARRDPAPVRVDPPEPAASDRVAMEARDGTTGAVIWSRPMRTSSAGWRRLPELLEGPDLDSDGVAELFAASFGDGPPLVPGVAGASRNGLDVEAMSGATGVVLWRWHRDLIDWSLSLPPSLRWRGSGPGKSPALVVHHRIDDLDRPSRGRDRTRTWVLRAEDGATIDELLDTLNVFPIDVNKDGTEDLISRPATDEEAESDESIDDPEGSASAGLGGAVVAFRGRDRAAWRRTGDLQPTGDLDGDRVDDALAIEFQADGHEQLRAVSTRDGHTLWRILLVFRADEMLRCGDLDGDDIADFLGNRDLLPLTFSGRTGQALGPRSTLSAIRGDRPAVVVALKATAAIEEEVGEWAIDLANGISIGPMEPMRRRLSGGDPGSARDLVTDGRMSWVEESGPIRPSRPGPDPRLTRPLPWTDRPTIRYVLGSVPFALVILALPAWTALRTARTRSLRWACLAVAAIALIFAAVRQGWLPIGVDDDLIVPQWEAAQLVGRAFIPVHQATRWELDPRWVRVAVGLPLVALVPALLAWRRRPLRVAMVAAFATGTVALGWWLADRGTLDPGDYYAQTDWYFVGFWGAYALGLVALVAWPIATTIRWLTHRQRRPQEANTP